MLQVVSESKFSSIFGTGPYLGAGLFSEQYLKQDSFPLFESAFPYHIPLLHHILGEIPLLKFLLYGTGKIWWYLPLNMNVECTDKINFCTIPLQIDSQKRSNIQSTPA